MPTSRERLEKVAEQIKNGVVPPQCTVRELLWWFHAERRGDNIVRNIRSSLEHAGLRTSPDFEYAYIDGHVSFVSAGEKSPVGDPTYRIGALESANRKPVSVKPDHPLSKATTVMLSQEFSQVPVMTNGRDVKGVVSWESIGSRLSLGSSCNFVRECMDPPQIIGIDASLFSAIEIIAQHQYVLVLDSDSKVGGIVTATDLTQQFRQLAEPFLLVGEIENHVRLLLHGKFTVKQLRDAKNPSDEDRNIEGISDLNFGEYARLLENEAHWNKLNLAIDQSAFVKSLHEVRGIRNDVMHFDPDGLSGDELKTLRDFARFLQVLRQRGVF